MPEENDKFIVDGKNHRKEYKKIVLSVANREIVKSIEGPGVLKDAIYAEFKVNKFVDDASEDEKKSIKWSVKIGSVIKEVIKQKSSTKYGAIEGNGRVKDSAYQGVVLKLEITKDMFSTFNTGNIKVLAYTNKPMDVELDVSIKWSGVGHCISLIRDVEILNPAWTTENVLNCMRSIAGYDDINFRILYGGGATPLAPGPKIVNNKQLETKLKSYLNHGEGKTENTETGHASEDPFYNHRVTVGHVCTGISGGFHRKKNFDYPNEVVTATTPSNVIIDLNPINNLKKTAGKVLGDKIDNLYTATIAGDIGQQANYNNDFSKKDKDKLFIGWETEATYAELVGDIDGFNIGNNISSFRGINLSEIFDKYYSNISKSTIRRRNRFNTFKKEGLQNLLKESEGFATNFAYKHRNKVGGLFSEIANEVKEVYDEFVKWLDKEIIKEQKTSKNY